MEKKVENVNSRIAAYRKLAGFTQAQAASLLNMKRNTYARMEKMGKPTPKQLKQIAELYRISVAMLIYGEDTTSVISEENSGKLILSRPDSNSVLPLSQTEANAIRILRELDDTDAQRVIKMINEMYKDKITSNG